MSILKNPFSREQGDELSASDLSLLSQEKKTGVSAETAAGQEAEKQQAEARESTRPASGEKLARVEQDIPNLSSSSSATPLSPAKSINLQKIEQAMESDLEEIYFNMDEAHQALLKAEGERAAREIDRIIATGKSVAVKILEVLKRWLLLIPGVSRFFIEQEAKIKTDKILKTTGTKLE